MVFINGNKRYLSKVNRQLLKELGLRGQNPFAVVVACSDSRVPVELIFDQLEPGNLFVIRVAGNIIADFSVIGSIEYALTALNPSFLVILGHSDCGAVKARLDGGTAGNVSRIIEQITINSQDINRAVRENVISQVNNALSIDAVKTASETGKLRIIGMVYDIASGKVEIIFPGSDTE